jgi:hypothetical protein
MHTQILSLPTESRHIGLDAAIGQIDMLGESGEVLRSWRIQSQKCTLGSGPECSVQMDAQVAAPLHATLVFGKKHTLLRAFAPIRIANRNVREWLIDHPTEIWIGGCRLVVHPTIAVMGTVVPAKDLIDLASRLFKETTAIVASTPPELAWEPALATHPTPVAQTRDAIDLSPNLASFERLLLSLQDSLERVHESLAASPERAQLQIQDYHQQLRAMESELDHAHQRIAHLSACLEAEQAIDKSVFAEPFENAGVVEPYFDETIESNAIEEDVSDPVSSGLPAWFRKDETPQGEIVTSEAETEAITLEERDFAHASPSYDDNSESAGEESIEEYMQRLLHRVRGTDIPPAADANLPPMRTSSGTVATRVVPSMGLDSSDVVPAPVSAEPLTSESFVPRQQAPEHRDELDALRELANSNARRALSRSDHRRMNSAFFLKLGVTGVAVSSAVALLLLNGLVLNMAFVGMIAAVVVGILWGYDCLTHFNKLQNDSQQIRDSAPRTAAMNAIQIGSADGLDDRWRPSVS